MGVSRPYPWTVRRWNLTSPDGAGNWIGLGLQVSKPEVPGLRVEVATGGRLLLRQAGQPVLFARVAADECDVAFYRTGRFQSPVTPLRAAHARTVASDCGEQWIARWAHHFATQLQASSAGPLHVGGWFLRPDGEHLPWGSARRGVERRWELLLVEGDPDGGINWNVHNATLEVLPLRRMSARDNARVKAYRRHAREGLLPPVLVWWVSGLDSYVVLDGHDRLVAAIAEDHEPTLLAVSTATTSWRVESAVEREVSRYAVGVAEAESATGAGSERVAGRVRDDGRRLAQVIAAAAEGGLTRAWAIRGGKNEWSREAGEVSAAWLAEVDRHSHADR